MRRYQSIGVAFSGSPKLPSVVACYIKDILSIWQCSSHGPGLASYLACQLPSPEEYSSIMEVQAPLNLPRATHPLWVTSPPSTDKKNPRSNMFTGKKRTKIHWSLSSINLDM
ncbi:hypothetical protein Bca101_030717 [Brassica carinata]